MKRFLNKSLRSLLALALSCCLLLGVASPAFAQESQDSELSQILSDLQSLMDKYGPEIDPEVQAGSRKGTGIDYDTANASYYVAIGDASVMRQTGMTTTYAELFAEALGVESKVLAEKKLLIENAGETVIAKNTAEIQKADLVSLGFSINGFALVAMNEILSGSDAEDSYLDWSLYLPAEGVAEVEDVLARMEKYLKDTGADVEYGALTLKFNVAEALVSAAECFAYGTLAYANALPKVVDEIHAINPNATVIVVGMDNPLDGSSVLLASGEAMELGSYVDKLIGFTGRISQTVAIEKENTVFVPVTNAANTNDGKELKDTDLLLTYVNHLEKAQPNDQGHTYIKNRMLGALELAGDADKNGEVNYLDAMQVLRTAVGLANMTPAEVYTCDTNYDEEVIYLDAMEILRAAVGLVELNKK